MKLLEAFALSFALARGVAGHQTQGILLVNGTESRRWQYVRDVADAFYNPPGSYPPGSDFPKVIPQYDIHSTNVTCGRSAFASASTTETADVIAGSEVGFRVSWDGRGEYGTFWHPGPAQIYLARAPNDDLENFRGDDGEWFKIALAGPVGNNEWAIFNKPDFNFTIPLTTPPGKYLMRIEQFMPTIELDYTQWYVNCAHINIIGNGGGVPSGFAQFPGTYDIHDPGLYIPKEQFYNGGYVKDEDMKLLDYVAPGPAVWTG